MAGSASTGGEVDERDGMVVDWSNLTEEDRFVVAELVAQEQEQQPQEEPDAAAEPLMTTSPLLMLLFLIRFSMILAVSRTLRVLLRRRSKHR